MNRFIPLLGIVLVVGGIMAAATYRDLERKSQAAQAFMVTLDRLWHDQQLSAALKTIREGDVDAAAQRLDLLLCDDILAVDSQLASANNTDRGYVQDVLATIARLRPRNSKTIAGATQEVSNDQTRAERILMRAWAETKLVKEDVVAMH